MKSHVVIKSAQISDVPAMLVFIFEHGVNQWNYLHQQSVSAHLADIEIARTQALLATIDGELTGFTTFMPSTGLAHYQTLGHRGSTHGYICEVVVHRERARRGVGTTLLRAATVQLAAQGFKEIYIERHEENLASAGMMRKAGFFEIAVFKDTKRRVAGSQRTSVSRLIL